MYPIKGDEQACITRGIRNTITCLFDFNSFCFMCVCFISMTNSFSIILNNCDDTFYSVCILREKKTFTWFLMLLQSKYFRNIVAFLIISTSICNLIWRNNQNHHCYSCWEPTWPVLHCFPCSIQTLLGAYQNVENVCYADFQRMNCNRCTVSLDHHVG